MKRCGVSGGRDEKVLGGECGGKCVGVWGQMRCVEKCGGGGVCGKM